MRLIVDSAKMDYLKRKIGIDSDRELAERSGLNQNTISRYRRGLPFDSSNLAKLARALECNPIDLQTVVENGEAVPEAFLLAPVGL